MGIIQKKREEVFLFQAPRQQHKLWEVIYQIILRTSAGGIFAGYGATLALLSERKCWTGY